MYLKSLLIHGVGPIDDIRIKTKFDDNGNPLPLVLVGPNGSGKTILTSYVTDAFVEFARCFYTNVVENEREYYKIVSCENITYNHNYSVVMLDFENQSDNENINRHYLFSEKVGNSTYDFTKDLGKDEIDDYSSLCDQSLRKGFAAFLTSKLESEGEKHIDGFISGAFYIDYNVEKVFSSNVLCCFSSDRFENANWFNEHSFNSSSLQNIHHYVGEQRIYRTLYNGLIVQSSQRENERWLCALLSDSQISNNKYLNEYSAEDCKNAKESANNMKKLVETILSYILQCKRVVLAKSYRDSESGFEINCYDSNCRKLSKVLIGLNQLSLGQSVLLNIFLTIVRYADQNSIFNLSDLNDIEGIVVIDEIDMHLDTDLQYDVLPKLISLFPKIQFIITTHSPLFLLGLENYKNKPNTSFDYQLLEMPNGNPIGVERFSEFKKAYNALKKTSQYETDLRNAIEDKIMNSPENSVLIIGEGKTDHLHLERALHKFQQLDHKYEDLNLIFQDNLEGDNPTGGKGNMTKFAKEFLKTLPYNTRYILLFDRDGEKIPFDSDGILIDDNICCIKLPIPEFRKDDIEHDRYKESSISIEHYYRDEEIKTPCLVNGVERRLYISDEFSKDTKNQLNGDLCYCGKKDCGQQTKCIIDGDSHNRVKKISEKADPRAINYALSKNDFFEKIVSDDSKNVSYKSFSSVFDLIEKCLKKMQ